MDWKALLECQLSLENKRVYSSSVIRNPDYHLWDNWVVEDQENPELVHLFSMAAAKTIPITEIDHRALWLHFISMDGGQSFTELGPILEADSEEHHTQHLRAIWSGSIRQRPDGLLWGLMTGLNKKRDFYQNIALVSQNKTGHTPLRFVRTLLDPIHDYEKLKKKGYYVAPPSQAGIGLEINQQVMAMRDPFIASNGTSDIVVYFAAKGIDQGYLRPAIGRFIIKDLWNNEEEVELLPPLFLPDDQNDLEIELPNVIERNGKRILSVNITQRFTRTTSDSNANLHARYYEMTDDEKLIPLGRVEDLDPNKYGYQYSWPSGQFSSCFYNRDQEKDTLLTLPGLIINN